MRLIDANKLRFRHTVKCNSNTTRPYTINCISFDEIQNAPTIKAVLIDVLDKIKTELHTNAEMHDDGDYYLRDKWIDYIFDKYNTEMR